MLTLRKLVSTIVGCALLHQPIVYAQQAVIDNTVLQLIRDRFVGNNLLNANVALGADGRVELSGSYRDRAEVQVAFSLAQSVVGVRRVAPTVPQQIEYISGNDSVCKFQAAMGIPCGSSAPVPDYSVKPTPPGYTSKRYALVVGVGNFQEKAIPALRFTVKDAQVVRDTLVDRGMGQFNPNDVILLTDEKATRQNIEAAMQQIENKVRAGDTVVAYFSSHGTPPNDQGNMNIVTYDTEVKPRAKVFHTSLSDERLSQFIQRLGQTNLMVILDTCYSGKAYEKVPGFLASGAKDLFLEEDLQTTQGFSQAALKNLGNTEKEEAAKLKKPAQGVRILFSASDAGQRSWESDSLEQSFFTYHLVQGFRKYNNAAQAYDYAKPLVVKQVKNEKQAVQTPQAFFFPHNGNLAFR
jgi:uncharacterized caspase-like protein